LDLASPREIRRTLDEAIENQQRTRPLFVSPGIVEAVASQKRVRVIFETDPRLTKDAALVLLGGPSGLARFDSLRVFPLLDRGAAAVGPQALLHLVENAGTGHIEFDMVHRPSLAETIPIIRADLAHQQGYDGDGFAVAILDTGVDSTHPMYADRLIEEACFSAQNQCPNGQSEMFGPGAAAPCALRGCGHGTRVAGIVLGDEPGGGLTGAAPHAELIAIQIFSIVAGELGAYSSDILAGLQHVLGLTAFHQIASANLSLGGDLFTSEAECDRTVASQFAAVALLRAANVLTIAASGNEGLTNAMTTPACLSNVIGVGSTSDFDEVSSFSNSASFLRLLAPGEAVESSVAVGGTALASGTSMASSHVAGVIATIREAIPSATADEIENALALSGVPVFDARNGITKPRIQVPEAITFLETNGPPPGGGSTPATTTSSSGGGGGCGLVGIESFLVLGLVRFAKRRRFARQQQA
jgi:subtilisin family serine protease